MESDFSLGSALGQTYTCLYKVCSKSNVSCFMLDHIIRGRCGGMAVEGEPSTSILFVFFGSENSCWNFVLHYHKCVDWIPNF